MANIYDDTEVPIDRIIGLWQSVLLAAFEDACRVIPHREPRRQMEDEPRDKFLTRKKNWRSRKPAKNLGEWFSRRPKWRQKDTDAKYAERLSGFRQRQTNMIRERDASRAFLLGGPGFEEIVFGANFDIDYVRAKVAKLERNGWVTDALVRRDKEAA